MAEGFSVQSPTGKQMRPTSSFFNSPRFFTSFCVKSLSETDSVMSPTSILDNKPCSSDLNGNPFSSSSRFSSEPCLDCKYNPFEKKSDSSRGGVGLGIVDALNDEEQFDDHKISKPNIRMVVFGSQLKIQIPSVNLSPSDSPKYPFDNFCIKTTNSQLGSSSFSPGSAKKSPFGSLNSSSGTPPADGSPRVFTGCLSASEMELSEDYTCIIAHGPNPRTTHIFEDCIVEDCCGFHGFSSFKKQNCFPTTTHHDPLSYHPDNFLSFCYNCKKNLGHGKDIYMYRGEKAFCSRECRQREILFDEGMEKTEMQ